MIADQVKSLCHQMRLFGFHEAAERRAAQALAEGLHPLEFLRLLLEDEILERRQRIGKMLVTKARFRASCDVEDWDSSYDRGITKAKLKDLAQLNFYHSRENLLLHGGTGAGKTHLAVSFGQRACRENFSVAFMPLNFLFEEANAQRAAGKYASHVRKLARTDIIIFDDFGLRNYTHDEATILVDLLEERYQKGSVIVTSQTKPEGWLKFFDDPVIAEAIVDRLCSPSQVIHVKGPSYRDKISPKSQPKAKT